MKITTIIIPALWYFCNLDDSFTVSKLSIFPQKFMLRAVLRGTTATMYFRVYLAVSAPCPYQLPKLSDPYTNKSSTKYATMECDMEKRKILPLRHAHYINTDTMYKLSTHSHLFVCSVSTELNTQHEKPCLLSMTNVRTHTSSGSQSAPSSPPVTCLMLLSCRLLNSHRTAIIASYTSGRSKQHRSTSDTHRGLGTMDRQGQN